IKIEEVADKGLLFTHKDYVFHLLKPQSEWTDPSLAPHERVMLENVFAGGSETRLSSLKNRFYTAVPIIREDIMSAVIWFLFARVMTAKTVKGARTRVAVLGFQEFMNRVDADRLKLMPPTTFEKFLPYAMALGVEHHWAQAFAGIVKDPPGWYVGPGGGYVPGTFFNPILFSSSMNSMATDMHQV